jgi:hypothetical protein
MRNRLLVVLAATGLFATQAMAQEYGKIYIGVGLAKIDLDTEVKIVGSGQTASYDDYAAGATAYLGYSLNDFISIEGGITYAGAVDGTETFPSSAGSPDTLTVKGSTDFRALEVVVKGTIPVGKFDLFGRGGLVRGDTSYDLNFLATETATGISSPSKLVAAYDDTGLLLGLGVGYRIGPATIRLQYDYMGLDITGADRAIITVPSGGNFVQTSTSIGITTEDPSRWLLSVSGNF